MVVVRSCWLICCAVGLGVGITTIGCGSRDDAEPAAVADDPPPGNAAVIENEDDVGSAKSGYVDESVAASKMLDEAFFVDPISSDLRSRDEYENLTRAIAKMTDADLKDKNLKAYVFEVQFDSQWWVDSVHDHHRTAFERQALLINANHVTPKECRVRTRFLRVE